MSDPDQAMSPSTGVASAALTTGHAYGDLSDPVAMRNRAVTLTTPISGDTLSPALDYRNYNGKNYVTPVKNQGNCGSCWAFAATAVLESKILLRNGETTDLSEQQQVSLNTAMGGCAGGNANALNFWSVGNVGPMDEVCTQYSQSNTPSQDLSQCGSEPYRLTKTSTGGYYTVDATNVAQVKTSLVTDGPAYFSFLVYQEWENFWYGPATGTAFTQPMPPTLPDGTLTKPIAGHAVTLIGWDDAKQAWLLKNSWGKGGPNGDGTFWMSWAGHAVDLGFGVANTKLPDLVETSARRSSVFSVARNHAELYTAGADGYLNFFYVNQGWTKDASHFTASRVTGDISAVYSPLRDHSEVFFQGEDGLLHFYYVDNGLWTHDGYSFATAGQIAGQISAIYSPYYNHSEVFVRGQDSRLHDFHVSNGVWKDDVGAAGPSQTEHVVGDVSAVFSPTRNQSEVYWGGSDGTLRFSYQTNNVWATDGQSFAQAGAVDHISAVYSPLRGHSEVFVRGADKKLHFFYVQNGVWAHDGTSFLAAGDVDGDISAVYSTIRNHSEVYFRGADGKLHQFYVKDGLWQHNSAVFNAGGAVLRDVTALFAPQRGYSEVFFGGVNNATEYFYGGPTPSFDGSSLQ